MFLNYLTSFQKFQLFRYGNIMPEQITLFPQDEDDYRQSLC